MIVLHYIPTLSPLDGGTATYMQQLAGSLGQKVTLHIVTHRKAEELEVRHASLHALTNSWRLWQVRKELKQILAEVRPDVVHVNCCWRPIFALVAVWAKEAGYRVVLTPHGMLEPWIVRRHYWSLKVPSLLLWQRKAFLCADVVHATAETEREHIEQLSKECCLLHDWHPQVRVIANAIDTESIALRKSWRKSHTLLFMSRLHPKKGLEMLLTAFDELSADQGPLSGYQLLIAGEGDEAYVRGLKTMIEGKTQRAQIKLLGGVYGAAKWQLLQDADLMVLPSHSENFGLVVAEALASGTPVLTTHGTPWAELNDRGCGWCVSIGLEALKQALTQFSQCDEEQLATMGHEGRKLVEEKYSASMMAEQFVEMYHSILCQS